MGDMYKDQSMEETLASIKRIIEQDVRAASRQARRDPPPPPAAADGAGEDVLELDDPVTEQGGLVSSDAASASRQALAALATLRDQGAAPPAPPSGGPLEEAVRDMLRPMLKDWLDQHLPEIVEQLVTREIARITGKSL